MNFGMRNRVGNRFTEKERINFSSNSSNSSSSCSSSTNGGAVVINGKNRERLKIRLNSYSNNDENHHTTKSVPQNTQQLCNSEISSSRENSSNKNCNIKPEREIDSRVNSSQHPQEQMRVPEIQMINKFYGLIPKKFIISERIRPSASLIRQKSSARPSTTKGRVSAGAKSSNCSDIEKNAQKQIRRCTSLDETKVENNTELIVPLVTKRISFEKNFTKCHKRSSSSILPIQIGVEEGKNDELLPKLLHQRVIKIDLNQMKWEEESLPEFVSDDEDDDIKDNREVKLVPLSINNRENVEKLTNKRRPITSDPTKNQPIISEQSKKRPITAAPSELFNSSLEKEHKDSCEVHWTAGKTTAERRSKFQKSFSIHPSFASSMSESFDFGGDESGCEMGQSEAKIYPESLVRVGRRSLHVEGPPEVDTMISKITKKGNNGNCESKEKLFYTTARSISLDENFYKTPELYKKLEEVKQAIQVPKVASCNAKTCIRENNFTKAPHKESIVLKSILSSESQDKLSASEKRKLFKKKCVSLPTEPQKIKSDDKKLRPAGKSLTRQNSSPSIGVLNSRTKLALSPKKSSQKKIVIAPNVKPKLRPRTAPLSINNNNNGEVGSSRSTHKNNHKKDPMRAIAAVGARSSSIESKINNSKTISSHSYSETLAVTNTMRKPQHPQNSKTIKSSTSSQSKDKSTSDKNKHIANETKNTKITQDAQLSDKVEPLGNKDVKENEMRQNPKMLPRRSFSLDETSLVNYSTSITDSIESIEISLQSSKRREECMKIYEKMKNGGCSVRLQTIFRGLMTPSEYRTFMTAAEKAIRVSSTDETEQVTLTTDENKTKIDNSLTENESQLTPSES